jgi:hypothetical protein
MWITTRRVLAHPTHRELEEARQPADDPCSLRCGRCSRCVRADWVARHGDYPGGRVVITYGQDYPTPECWDDTAATGPGRVKITPLFEVVPQRIQWLWPGYIPMGYGTVVEGDPDLGKSTVTIDIAAQITRGDLMPDGTPGLDKPRNVLLMSAEDGLDDVIVHRARLAGADLKRLLHVGDLIKPDGSAAAALTLPTHTREIGELVEYYRAPLLIVDVLWRTRTPASSWSVSKTGAPYSATCRTLRTGTGALWR